MRVLSCCRCTVWRCATLCWEIRPVLWALPGSSFTAAPGSVGAAAWPFLVLHSCCVILLHVRAAALPLQEWEANKAEGVRLPPGLWVGSVSELSPWFCFYSQNGFGWLK